MTSQALQQLVENWRKEILHYELENPGPISTHVAEAYRICADELDTVIAASREPELTDGEIRQRLRATLRRVPAAPRDAEDAKDPTDEAFIAAVHRAIAEGNPTLHMVKVVPNGAPKGDAEDARPLDPQFVQRLRWLADRVQAAHAWLFEKDDISLAVEEAQRPHLMSECTEDHEGCNLVSLVVAARKAADLLASARQEATPTTKEHEPAQ